MSVVAQPAPAHAREESTLMAMNTPVSAAATKGSINLRIDGDTRRLIDEAADMLGKTRTEFMIESARARAVDVLLDQRFFPVDGDGYDAFARVLADPPRPGPKLQALLQRTPAWEA